jgi:hypothetical protein
MDDYYLVNPVQKDMTSELAKNIWFLAQTYRIPDLLCAKMFNTG